MAMLEFAPLTPTYELDMAMLGYNPTYKSVGVVGWSERSELQHMAEASCYGAYSAKTASTGGARIKVSRGNSPNTRR